MKEDSKGVYSCESEQSHSVPPLSLSNSHLVILLHLMVYLFLNLFSDIKTDFKKPIKMRAKKLKLTRNQLIQLIPPERRRKKQQNGIDLQSADKHNEG